tara:strand:+ start:2751 stop:3902 length:1152 start_codon:yes stop_codon:yes gene_type:complete
MNFSIFVRGRGYAFQIADNLNKKGELKKINTTYPKFIAEKYNIPRKKVSSFFFIEIFTRLMHFLAKKLKINLKTSLIADWSTDWVYSIFSVSKADYYITGFGTSACRIIDKANKKNIKSIYYLNNSAPKNRLKVKEEYEKYGLIEYYNEEDKNVTERINISIKKATYVGCISSYQRNTYINEGILDQNKSFITTMSVDNNIFFPTKIKKKKFIVIGVGNDFVRKGFKYLIDGFNSLNLSEAELWIVTNFERKLISRIVNLENNNRILKPVKEFDLPKLYNESSLFCLPTLEEGSPQVIPQAMACGLPIIATKNCQAPDVIDNNKNGFVVEEKNSTQIAEKIKFFYDNPDQLIIKSKNSAEYANKNLTFSKMSSDLVLFCKQNL